ncbi:MAG: transglutaminase domain-containing protein [Candidatus Hodarchaeota archaeon]
MVSKRSILAAISLIVILFLILSFLWPLLFLPPIPRQRPFDNIPDWGSGVTVEGDEGTFMDNITYDDFSLDLNWSIDPTFTVAIVSPADPPRYWRNTAYDRYLGTDWEKSNDTTHILDPVPPGSEIVYTISQNITHPTVTGAFALLSLWPDPMVIAGSVQCPQLPYSDSYDLLTDQYGTAILNGRFSETGTTTLQYQITYNPLNWTDIRPNAQSASLTPSALLSQYQQQGLNQMSPSTIADVQSRLNTILTTVPDNAFEEAFAILNYFKATFTFDPFVARPSSSEEHVEWFLSQGAGVGVDFATTYAMFLRQAGIAARPVVGAILGENQGTRRILHPMHIHFWVEVYIPVSPTQGYWLQFDPTPLPSFITDGSPPPVPSTRSSPEPKPPDQDPYVISTYYNLTIEVTPPIVDRGVPFQIRATLTQDGVPSAGQTLWFYDETENWVLGSNTTTATGEASITFQYNGTAIVGFHLLRVAFSARSEYSAIALHGAASLSFSATPLELNRTMYVRFNGTLTDATNGRGLSVYETGYTGVNVLLNLVVVTQALTDSQGRYSIDYRVPASHVPLGLTAAQAGFVIPSVIDAVLSLSEDVNITATSLLSVQAIPNSIRLNSPTIIQGQLRFENGTGIANQPIQLLWNSTPLSSTTDSSGYYTYNYTPTQVGQVTLQAQFLGNGSLYVFGSQAINLARVHEEGSIIVFVSDDDGDDITQRGATVQYSGWVEDQDGNPQGGITVRIYLNQTQVIETITLPNGSYSVNHLLGPTLSVGLMEVTGDIVSGTLQVVSSIDYFVINSTTQIQNLVIDRSQAMLGETVTLTGQIIDDQGVGLSGQSVGVSISYLSTFIPVGTVLAQTGGTFSLPFTLPFSIPGSVSTVSINASYMRTSYYGFSNNSQLLSVFSNATLLIDVLPGPYAWNATVVVNGTLLDNFGRALILRDIQLFVNGTTRISAVSDSAGHVSFSINFAPSGNQDTQYRLELRHETIITLNSTVRTITVEAEEIMQPPPLNFPLEWIIAIAIGIIVIVAVILGYRYWKRRPRTTTAPSIDAAAMLTTLRQLLTQQKYRDAIIYAFRMFETILQAKLGLFRDPSITVREFGNLAVAHGRLDTRNMEVFIRGVEEARYSDHPISYNTALSALNAFAKMYNSLTGGNLRFVTQEQQSPESTTEQTEGG